MSENRYRIIMVDDDDDDRDLFAEALEILKLHENMVLFSSGKELLQYIEEIDRSLTTFLFLDLNMPEISGMDVLNRLRKTLQIDNLFVTVYSTSSAPRDIEAAYISGANGYITKPSNFQKLQELILKAIGLASSGANRQLPKQMFVLNND